MAPEEDYTDFLARRKRDAENATAVKAEEQRAQQKRAVDRHVLVNNFERVRTLVTTAVRQVRQDVKDFAILEVVGGTDLSIEVHYRRKGAARRDGANMLVKLNEEGQVAAAMVTGAFVTKESKIKGTPIAVDSFASNHAVEAIKEFVKKADKA